MRNKTQHFTLLIAVALLTGCSRAFLTPDYMTPGGGVEMLEITDADLKSYYDTRPATTFPASIAVIRVQDSGYQSHSHHGYGSGRYSIVTTRDIETDAAFARLQQLADVDGVAPIGRMLVPANANTVKDLRIPAAKLHADMLLVYSVDTSFTVDGKQLGPLSMLSLGLIPNKKAHVTATVAGVLVDVRTGYIYGTTEASSTQEQRATIWSTQTAIETARLRAEKEAFDGFVGDFEKLWPGVVSTYRGKAPAYSSDAAESEQYHFVRFEAASDQANSQ